MKGAGSDLSGPDDVEKSFLRATSNMLQKAYNLRVMALTAGKEDGVMRLQWEAENLSFRFQLPYNQVTHGKAAGMV